VRSAALATLFGREHSAAPSVAKLPPMDNRLAAPSLMLGNFVVGVCVLAPAGMLNELSAGLAVSIGQVGLLITYGAVVLCFGSPLVSWLTSRMDRRTLMSGILLLLALGNLASAFAPNYAALLVIRLLMLVAAAPFTPQAASTIALIVSPERRPGAIAFVFLGWSLSLAIGLPLIGYLAHQFGWRASFGVLAAASAIVFVLLAVGLPGALRGAPVSLASWGAILRDRRILLLLAVTALTIAGPFGTFTFLAAVLKHFLSADAATISLFFALFGFAGLIGNIIATRIVTRVGALTTTVGFMLSSLAGAIVWSLGAGWFGAMIVGAGLWGLGFASINSMQQARLIAAAPALAAGSVALNTSAIYIGQAVGSGVGGVLVERSMFSALGYVAIAFLVASTLVLLLTRAPNEKLLSRAA